VSDKATQGICNSREGKSLPAESVTYHFSIPKPHSLTVAELSRILPPHFMCQEKDDKLLIILETESSVSDDAVHFEVTRELARIFFLTGEDLRLSLLTKEYDGIKEAATYIKFGATLVRRIDPRIERQEWSWNLGLQLHYWRLAVREDDVAAKVQLLFKVIEISFPKTRDREHYPEYLDASQPLVPKTECKLLRDLVSHQGGKTLPQLKNYSRFLGRKSNEKFFDPTAPKDRIILKQRLSVIEKIARDVIHAAITRRT